MVPKLRDHGHDVVVDLPCDDDAAGLAEYTDTVVHAIGGRTDLAVVAQSMGGFTAPLVCDRVPVDLRAPAALARPKEPPSPPCLPGRLEPARAAVGDW